MLRWHRDIVRCRWAARPIRGKTGRPATRRNIKALALVTGSGNPWRRAFGITPSSAASRAPVRPVQLRAARPVPLETEPRL